MRPLAIITLLSCSGAAVALAGGSQFEQQTATKRTNPEPACLAESAVQSASFYTGLEEGNPGAKPGVAASKTDASNFINFCANSTLTNGQQNPDGSCNGIPMGRLPATTNMISSIITFPQPGDQLPPNTSFNVTIQTSHLRAGFFANPVSNYYTAPQDLDENGDVIGHCHVTIQNIGSFTTLVAPDPTVFAYFKGIDDVGDGKGGLTAEISGGLPVGVYRVCTMVAAMNHQPVMMPVAQRGAQDDCTKFEVREEHHCHQHHH
ncbi:uncharacterized protein C8A04DRAFT_13287 [Dichotomopilus funicola]|uniref:Uncharacterized protein n=1 Tax=Dichotomopilus funicola TaxID=1934379 RepID=A0AAN6V0D7_9PEZI|nr:hypothetical protein C8A04DRAFT_13287 [Dichotomopilus funicola]